MYAELSLIYKKIDKNQKLPNQLRNAPRFVYRVWLATNSPIARAKISLGYRRLANNQKINKKLKYKTKDLK